MKYHITDHITDNLLSKSYFVCSFFPTDKTVYSKPFAYV